MELGLAGKISLDGHQKLRVVDPTPVGDEILDLELNRIASAGQSKKTATWIHALGQNKQRKLIADSLVQQGILEKDGKDYRWAAPSDRSKSPYISSKYCLKQQMRGMVLALEPHDARLLALFGLLRACRLTNLVFTKDERKAAGKQIDRLMVFDAIDAGLSGLFEDIEHAVARAVRAD
jgi:hypothetical protein